MKKKVLIGVGIFFLLLLIVISWYFIELRPVGSDNNIDFEIKSGTPTVSIIKNLKDKKLIHSELAVKIYIFLSNKDSLQAGTYELNQNMSVKDIIDAIDNGNVKNNNITLTFKEGKRFVNYLKDISDAFGYNEQDLFNELSNKDYLNTLINKYWFLSDDILDSKIYYPLDGYLYPDTYTFKPDATIDDIITKMLDNMNNKLTPYKDAIASSNYSVHQILTLSSIIELEAKTLGDRKGVSGVFANRLKDSWTLGSDVTSYYGVKKEMTDNITQDELNDCNSYNTRSSCVPSLPIGPICNPSIDAINAALNPTESNYYFFVADTNSKVYFSVTASDQLDVIATLKSQNMWYNY